MYVSLANAQVNYCYVGPIIAGKCLPCHNGKGAAPFNFSDYDGLHTSATLIKKVVDNGYMPPWPANNNYAAYKHVKSLSVKEKNTLLDWLNTGLANCNYTNPKTAIVKGAKPNIVLGMKKHYDVKPATTDKFVHFLLTDSVLKKPLNVSKFVFKPGNLGVVHHIELIAVKFNKNNEPVKLNDGYVCIDTSEYDNHQTIFKTYDYVSGWLPGQDAEVFPKGFVKQIPKGVHLVLLVHYAPTAIVEADSSTVEIFTPTQPNPIVLNTFSLHGHTDIEGKFVLPANKVTTLTAKKVLDKPLKLYSVLAHLHHLAKSLEAYAITPDNKKINILQIDNWQFNWQYEYAFAIPQYLPANSTVYFTVTYDNTINNIENPNNPPKDVGYSFNADQEMMELFLSGQYNP